MNFLVVARDQSQVKTDEYPELAVFIRQIWAQEVR